MTSTKKIPARIPCAFFAAILLVAAIEIRLGRVEVGLMTTGELNWRVTAWAATHRSRECDVLCLGDSQMKHGIAPRVLEDRTGSKAYNLALVAGSPPSTYYTLKLALDAGARPSALVVDFKPLFLEQKPQFGRAIWGELLDLRGAAEASFAARDAGVFAILSLTKLLPSARARPAFRTRILEALGGRAEPLPSPTLPMNLHANRNRGAMLLEVNPYYRAPLREVREDNRTIAARPDVDPVNALYLRKFLDLAASRGIAVYWVLPPIDPFAQAWREQRGYEAKYEQFLRGYCAQYPNLTILDARHSNYDASTLWDPTHLNHVGAAALSEDLAAILIGAKSKEKWVAMPSYAKRPEGATMERIDLIALMQRSRR